MKLPYTFRDPALLERACTHPSWTHVHGGSDYEQLEHLGDAVLQLSVTARLLVRLADAAEGTLTHLRQRVVNGETLAAVAREQGLGEAMRLSAGAEAEGIRDRPSVLANLVEAVLGAVFLDGGYEAADALIGAWLGPRIEATAAAGVAEARHPKSLLQERTQEAVGRVPTYVTVEQEGPAHAPRFAVEVRLDARVIGRGVGSSVREAERQAAMDALGARSWRVAP